MDGLGLPFHHKLDLDTLIRWKIEKEKEVYDALKERVVSGIHKIEDHWYIKNM